MKKITIVLALLFTFQINAQHDEAYVDKLVTEFTDKLEERSISNWFSVKRYCTGTVEMFQMDDGRMCASKGTYFEVYVVWNEENSSMIKKIDNCGLFYSVPLQSNILMDFVNNSYLDLQTTSVKTYSAEKITGTPELRTSVSPCKRLFVFKKKGSVMKQLFNLYDLTTNNEHPNVHYDYNNSLKIVELNNMLNEVIENLQSKFRRQKQ